MKYYDRLASLPLHIDDYRLSLHEQETPGDFTRATTVIELQGDGVRGYGEDVTWSRDDAIAFLESGTGLRITGDYTLDEFSKYVGGLDLFPEGGSDHKSFRRYRRWGFESAALDLALQQSGRNLGEVLGISYKPVRFVMSTGLGDPPELTRVTGWLDRYSALEFKLDPADSWSEQIIDILAGTGAVRILDFKGLYDPELVAHPEDPELYRSLIERFPDALLEDPDLNESTRPLVENEVSRITWDYPIVDVASVERLPWKPQWLNIKPSRFGSLKRLFDTLSYCQSKGIQMYGGGQFELDAGRRQIHALASLFYADSPNDVAPAEYHNPVPQDNPPHSPLPVPGSITGFGW